MENKTEQVLARELRAEQHKDEQEHKDTCKQTNRYTKLIAWSLFFDRNDLRSNRISWQDFGITNCLFRRFDRRAERQERTK